MKFVFKLLTFLFSVYGLVVFIGVMLLLFPFFIIAFLLPEIPGGNMVYFLSRTWADIFFFLTGIHHYTIYEARPEKDQEYLFVSNHISYMDIPMMMKAIRRRKLRILGKAEMTKIPLFGSIYKRGTVSVNRKNPAERARSVQKLIRFLNKNISVFICPEGTFNKTHQPLKSFYDGAFKIAIETQKPLCPILFPDTYDRLNYNSIFSLTPGKCRSVYLPATATQGLTLDDMPQLKDRIYRQMEEALIRYRASWILPGADFPENKANT